MKIWRTEQSRETQKGLGQRAVSYVSERQCERRQVSLVLSAPISGAEFGLAGNESYGELR